MAQQPIILQLPATDGKLITSSLEGGFSYNHDYPQFSLGFHYFLHQNIDKLDLKPFEGKKPVYRVINPYETSIDEHDSDIDHLAKVYFSVGPKPGVVDRSFYKLWEMNLRFGLVDPSVSGFKSVHLADGPGGFLQSTLMFREMFAKGFKSDQYYGITLHKEVGSLVPPINDKLAKYYKQIKISPTYSKSQSGGDPNRHNGDLTQLKTIRLLGGAIGGGAHLVTGNGGVNWKTDSEILREQEGMKLILGQIVAALTVQGRGGHLVLRFYETYTRTTLKLLNLLNDCYKVCFICKPLMSRPTDVERYFIGKQFKLDEKARAKVVTRLAKIMSRLENPRENLVDLAPSMRVAKEFKTAVTIANTQISTQQYMKINDTVAFIKSNNYYGDTYQDSRDAQIKATKLWVDEFFVSKAKLTPQLKQLETDTKNSIGKNKDLVEDLFNRL